MSRNLDAVEAKIKMVEQLTAQQAMPRAVTEIKKLCRKGVPRKFAADLGHFARLCSQYDRAIGLLYPYVRPPRGSITEPSDVEKAVYATTLVEIGATGEATELLKSIDGDKVPRVHFGRGLAEVKTWNWKAAIPHFEAALERGHPASSAANKAWLGAAYMYGTANFQRSRILLEESLRESTASANLFVHQRALKFLVESYFLLRDWRHATRAIERLERLADEEGVIYYRKIAQQWRIMVSAFNPRDQRHQLEELTAIRDWFLAREHWEDARSCDFYRASHSRDLALLTHLYFGTPFASLRSRIEQLVGGVEKLPQQYLWMPDGKTKSSHALNVLTGESDLSRARLKSGQNLQRLLALLCSDFYCPMRLAQVHEHLYPGDYFNPLSSPDRVHQVMHRLRSWLTKAKVPLTIAEQGGYYHVRTARGLALELFRDPEQVAAQLTQPLGVAAARALDQLRGQFKKQPFSAQQAAAALDVSYRSAAGYMKAFTERGITTKLGAGPATVYRFAK